MKLKKLVLTNFKQHKSRTVEFGDGVTGIVGPNGSGKTNLVTAVEFALTGVMPSWGTKERCITWGADKGEVELYFESNGHDGMIKRSLHSSSCRLKYAGEDLKKAEQVNERMKSILGVSAKVMSNYVFTHQGETDQVLLAKPANRMQLFSVLFGTDYCERIRTALSEELQSRVTINTATDKDMLTTRLNETRTRIGELQQKMHVCGAAMAGINEAELRQRCAAATRDANQYLDPTNGFEATNRVITGIRQQLPVEEQRLEQLTTNYKTTKEVLDQLANDIAVHRHVIQQAEQIRQAQARRAQLLKQVGVLQTQLESQPEPGLVADKDQVMDLYESQELRPLEQQVLELRRFIAGFQQGSCPSCGTQAIVHFVPTPTGVQEQRINIQERIVTSSNALQELEPRVKKERDELDKYRYERRTTAARHAQWESRKNAIAGELRGLQSSLEAIPPQEIPDAEAAQRAISLFEQGQLQLKSMSDWIAAGSKTIEDSKRTELVLSERLKQLSLLSVVNVAEDQAKLTAYDQAAKESATINGQLQEANRQIIDFEARIKALEELAKKDANLMAYRQMVSEAMGVLHRDNYPAAVARLRLEQLNRGWNLMLRLLDQPYQVAIEPDMNIMMTFDTGKAYIEEISGGQKMCASIAYVMEVNQRFANQTGFVVLDEPTAYVDSDHIPTIRDLLLEMQRYSSSTGLQIIVITHEERLMPGFTSVIDMRTAG